MARKILFVVDDGHALHFVLDMEIRLYPTLHVAQRRHLVVLRPDMFVSGKDWLHEPPLR